MSTAVLTPPEQTAFEPVLDSADAPPPRARGGRVRRRLRPVLFWLHLALGSALGLVILTQALSGMSIAYRRQIVSAVVGAQVAAPPAGAVRLSLDTLAARAAATAPGQRVGSVTLRQDPRAPVSVQFGRERTAYVDPYTGQVLPGAPRLEAFFAYMEGVHRWLAFTGGRSDLGATITGVSVLTFFGLLLSGLYLWLPARWTRRHVRAVAVPNGAARGRARDWNLHHVAGLWASPVLLVMIVAGVFMAFEWPTRLVARATGSPIAERGGSGGGGAGRPGGRAEGRPDGRAEGRPDAGVRTAAMAAPRASLDTLAARALAAAPGAWYAVQLRLGGGPGQRPGAGGRSGPAGITAAVTRSANLRPDLTTQLTLDPATGALRSQQNYAAQDVARRVRGWMHPVHSGEGFGLLGETLAVLGALAATVLVWTGLALALRRLRRQLSRGARGYAA